MRPCKKHRNQGTCSSQRFYYQIPVEQVSRACGIRPFDFLMKLVHLGPVIIILLKFPNLEEWMKIEQIPVGFMQVFCYLVYDEETKEGILIDPAGNEEDLLEHMRQKGVKLRYIVNTHGHADHTCGNEHDKEGDRRKRGYARHRRSFFSKTGEHDVCPQHGPGGLRTGRRARAGRR